MVVKINNIFCGLIRLVGVEEGWMMPVYAYEDFSTVGIFFQQ